MITMRPMGKKATCTLMIMTRNGAKTIKRAIQSALDCKCFEYILIMLDTRSTDDTGAIVSRYQTLYPSTIRIIGHNWKYPADFAEARNRMIGHALQHLHTEYASWLDDDEVISDCDAFRFLLSRASGAAYLVWVISPLRGGGSHDMFQPRLFPLLHGAIFECPVFERIDFSLRRSGIPILSSNFRPIHHDGYTDPGKLAGKSERNRGIITEFMHSKTASSLNISEQYQHMQQQQATMNGNLAGIDFHSFP